MPLNRQALELPYWEYVSKYALVSLAQPTNASIPPLARGWISIPRFQRGISWSVDEHVNGFLKTSSVFLGNVILSQATTPTTWANFSPTTSVHHLELIDGLQRFAMGTALLNILYPMVLSPTPSAPGEQQHFRTLLAHVAHFQPLFSHNDHELRNHPRLAIKDQYSTFTSQLKRYVNDEFDAGHAATIGMQVTNLFTRRDVALDSYFNLTQPDVLNAFIGVNTARVDLSSVDIVRAYILKRADSASWSATDIEAAENDFTECFTEDEKPKQALLPFVNAVRRLIEQNLAQRVFPSWTTGFVKGDLDSLIDFIDQFESSTPSNGFLSEIAACGALPASITLAYYYLNFLHVSGTHPAFFQGAATCDAELHMFLRAAYRVLLQGSIGRTGDFLDDVLAGRRPAPLPTLADELCHEHTARRLNQPVDPAWLESKLGEVDKNKAKRVFNAMLLPPLISPNAQYSPLVFSRRRNSFHVDHLIPESTLAPHTPGSAEGTTLRNLSPLPSNLNIAAKATSCSIKLGPNGIYDNYCRAAGTPHPYCNWLVNAAGVQGADLDKQGLLQPNSQPDVGTQRISKIRDELRSRL
jgi:hypothetical protein